MCPPVFIQFVIIFKGDRAFLQQENVPLCRRSRADRHFTGSLRPLVLRVAILNEDIMMFVVGHVRA